MGEEIATEVSGSLLHWLLSSLGPLGWLIVCLGFVLVAWGVAGFFIRSHAARVVHLFASFAPLVLGLAGLIQAVLAFEALATGANVKPAELGNVISAGLAQGIAASVVTLVSGLLGGANFALRSRGAIHSGPPSS